MNIGPTWTEERIDDLRRKCAAGLTVTQIAHDLGVTRNAITGKARRMGIHVTSYAEKRELGVMLPARKRTQRKQIDRSDPALRFACTIMDLTSETCRWPMGEPAHDMLYCGAPIPMGSYCGYHQSVAYQPAKRRA